MNEHLFSHSLGSHFLDTVDVGMDVADYTGMMPIYDRNGTLVHEITLTFREDNTIDLEADSESWEAGSYEYYLRITSPGGVVTDILEGHFCVG